MEYLNIILGFILIILVYCFYLNIVHKNNKIEGFANTIDSLVGPNDKIEKLIEIMENKSFGIKLWDNYNVLSNSYNKINQNLPNNLNECRALIKTGKVNNIDSTVNNFTMDNALSNIVCPISIWRPTPGNSFDSIGDVMTTSYKNPNLEAVIDFTKPITSTTPNVKNLTTKSVTGVNVKEPEDFLYIGGFGKDIMNDRLLNNELFNQSSKKIRFYLNIFKDAMKIKQDKFKNDVNTIMKTNQDTFSLYIDQLEKFAKFEPVNYNSILNIKNIINENSFVQNNKMMSLSNTFISNNSIERNSKVLFDVRKEKITVPNPFNLYSSISKMPTQIKDVLFKDYDYQNENNAFSASKHSYSISNINIVPVSKLSGYFGTTKNYSYNPEGAHTGINIDEHSLIESPENVEINISTIKENITRDSGVKGFFTNNQIRRNRSRRNVMIGKINSKDQMMLTFHRSDLDLDDDQDAEVISMDFNIHSAYINILTNDIVNDKDLSDKYNNLIKSIKDFYLLNPNLEKTDFYRLNIWQPVPPPGYVALGFVFTNDSPDVKPSTQLIKCIPETCVKSFKRRKWNKDDIIYLYSDTTQKLAFYRNPYLGTVVVVDLNKNTTNTAGPNTGNEIPTPSNIKYRGEKEALSWDCFDIIPCIKECDYVKRLEDADKNARKMCTAYKGLENKYFDKTEVKKSIQDEENKLNTLLKDKKTYINNLMNNINNVMSEDELYKIITQGLNRYKAKKDLENQYELHGKVADKLLQTRGLEISWDAPEEMVKFKDLLKRLVIAQYSKTSKSNNNRGCPVCKLPDTKEFVQLKDLELCYGCLEDVVRELIGQKKKAGEPIPPELLELQKPA